ncbi:MAG: polysulfide reductase NrfD [Desulfobacterales bacterium]|nr:polysulfide reductase NrfD [Desulfobacterales bacterium]
MIRIKEETADRWGYLGKKELLSSKPVLAVMVVMSMVAVAAFTVGLDGTFTGYRHVYAVTRQIPWGLLISGYIFCVVTSTGLCLVSSIGHVFGYEPYMPIAKRAVFLSIAFMLGGFSIIFFDVENPFRMPIYNVLSPNLTSNMWWMGTLYGLYLLALGIEYYFLLEQNHGMSRFSGLLGVLFGVAAHSNLGAVFGMLHGREFWYGPYMPIYFIVSAMMSGGAAIIFFTCIAAMINPDILNRRMERAIKAVCQLTIMLIAIIMFFTVWKIISGLVAPEKYIAIKAFITGPYALTFWIAEIGLGMVLPFILLIRSKGVHYKHMFVASAMMMIGIFFMRYNLVLAGQIVPVYHGLHVEEYSSLLKYFPSFHEIAVVVGGVFLAGILFLVGEKILNGHQFQKHEIVPPGAFICPGCGGIHYRKEGETDEEALQRHHRIRKFKG